MYICPYNYTGIMWKGQFFIKKKRKILYNHFQRDIDFFLGKKMSVGPS